MPLLNDILDWSTTLPDWHRDALRRLFQKSVLDAQDYDQLYDILKATNGIPPTSPVGAAPLDASHLPTATAGLPPTFLSAMWNLRDVNLIDSSQKLSFAHTGMTVIYGHNGTGKSGYARVLKRACRARDIDESVLPDANDPVAQSRIPSAQFEISQNGTTGQLTWASNAAAPGQLSSISVFDTRCARTYVDVEQDVAYLPYGLDIVENLGRTVVPAIENKLNTDIRSINVDVSPYSDLYGPTKVGSIISKLNPDTDINSLTALGTLSSHEQTRLVELDKILAEADPATKAHGIRISIQRLSDLKTRISDAFDFVSDSNITGLHKLDAEAQIAQAAEKQTVEKLQAGDKLLAGTGGIHWKRLIDAAETYSLEAYPGRDFPNNEEGAKCPLCQQTLEQSSVQRLKRFKEFLTSSTGQATRKTAADLKTGLDSLKKANLSFGIDKAHEAELKQLSSALLSKITNFQNQINEKRNFIVAAVEKHDQTPVPQLVDDPRTEIDALNQAMTQQAADLDKASNAAQKKILDDERAELRMRTNLAGRLPNILNLIKSMQARRKLEACKSSLRKKAITDKAREFTASAVTTALRTALNDEFQTLGVGHIKTRLLERGEAGKTKVKLVLDLTESFKVDQVLSEGEQRAIALGSFFAELKLANHGCGIVFDDPVSSLDHVFRRRVARRMMAEAKKRQVIVFTHDAAFLGDLVDAGLDLSVKLQTCHLEVKANRTGLVIESLPWTHMDYKQRLAALKAKQTTIANKGVTIPTAADIADMTHAYSLLRATVERVIQDVLLGGIVTRYSDHVKVHELENLSLLTPTECKEIQKLYKKCHTIADAHDPSAAKPPSVPDHAELGADIARLEGVISSVIAARKAAEAAKKAATP